jgi:uncharacterized protein YoxC
VTRGIELLHSPQTKDSVAQALKSSVNPVQGVADQSREILKRVDQLARREGNEINYESKIMGAAELVSEVADYAESVGVEPLDAKDRELAYSLSAQDYLKGEIAEGRVSPEELQQGVASSMSQMDRAQMEGINQQMLQINDTASRLKKKYPIPGGGQQPATNEVK